MSFRHWIGQKKNAFRVAEAGFLYLGFHGTSLHAIRGRSQCPSKALLSSWSWKTYFELVLSLVTLDKNLVDVWCISAIFISYKLQVFVPGPVKLQFVLMGVMVRGTKITNLNLKHFMVRSWAHLSQCIIQNKLPSAHFSKTQIFELKSSNLLCLARKHRHICWTFRALVNPNFRRPDWYPAGAHHQTAGGQWHRDALQLRLLLADRCQSSEGRLRRLRRLYKDIGLQFASQFGKGCGWIHLWPVWVFWDVNCEYSLQNIVQFWVLSCDVTVWFTSQVKFVTYSSYIQWSFFKVDPRPRSWWVTELERMWGGPLGQHQRRKLEDEAVTNLSPESTSFVVFYLIFLSGKKWGWRKAF